MAGPLPSPFARPGLTLHGEVAGDGPLVLALHGLTAARRYVLHGSRSHRTLRLPRRPLRRPRPWTVGSGAGTVGLPVRRVRRGCGRHTRPPRCRARRARRPLDGRPHRSPRRPDPPRPRRRIGPGCSGPFGAPVQQPRALGRPGRRPRARRPRGDARRARATRRTRAVGGVAAHRHPATARANTCTPKPSPMRCGRRHARRPSTVWRR